LADPRRIIVHEQGNRRNHGRQLATDPHGMFGFDESPTPAAEDESQRINAKIGRQACVFLARDATKLDADAAHRGQTSSGNPNARG
jgi:hypothetical protein